MSQKNQDGEIYAQPGDWTTPVPYLLRRESRLKINSDKPLLGNKHHLIRSWNNFAISNTIMPVCLATLTCYMYVQIYSILGFYSSDQLILWLQNPVKIPFNNITVHKQTKNWWLFIHSSHLYLDLSDPFNPV